MTALILYTDGKSQIKLQAKSQTIWLSQRKITACLSTLDVLITLESQSPTLLRPIKRV